MGNDGGSIPTRRELVKEAARNPTTAELKESQLEQQDYHWATDPISQEPLARPIVSDASGKLFNKDTILEYLVEGKRKEDADRIFQGSVKSLKDVVNIQFEVDEDATASHNGGTRQEIWKCPITGDKLGPGSKAVYLVPCGHAFSGRAIKEVSGEKCLSCETEYASNDIIPIVPTSATDIARLSLRMKTLQEKGLTHSLKKVAGASKKRKKKEEHDGGGTVPTLIDAKSPDVGTGHQSAVAEAKPQGTINNSLAASLTAKVLEEQARLKKRKMNDNVSSLFSSRDSSKPSGTSADFMTRGFSMPSGTQR